MFNVQFTPKGQTDLEKLPKDLQRRIVKKISFFISLPNPLYFSKPLVDLPLFFHGWSSCRLHVDKNVSVAMGKYYASQIPNSKLTVYPNEGYLAQITHAEEILNTLTH